MNSSQNTSLQQRATESQRQHKCEQFIPEPLNAKSIKANWISFPNKYCVVRQAHYQINNNNCKPIIFL